MFTTRPELIGSFGMVASTHWLASAAGMSVLERGGNAFDAVVAAGFVLQVVEPHNNGPGGEAPMVFYSADRDETLVVDGQGVAPRRATISHFNSLGLDLVPGTGLLPACVPAAFGAWMLLLKEFGTMRPADVMSYAIAYAEDGWPMGAATAAVIRAVEELFRAEWTESAALYLSGDRAPEPGERAHNRALAATYRRVLAEAEAATPDRDGQIDAARDCWYSGFVAEAIDAYVGRAEVMDSSGRRHRGLLTGEDMASWEARLEAPVSLDYGGYRVCKTGPWGQGPVFLQQLALLSGFDLEAMGPNSADFIHTVVECSKLAFADREAWYGDPEFVDVPIGELLGGDYAARRRALLGPSASRELRPGDVAGRSARLPRGPGTGPYRPSGAEGEPTMALRRDTCHVDAADRFGNLVAATPSGGWLQGSPVIPELGFPLGTRGQMFWLEDGHANSLAPGKRPRTTLSPSLALRDGEPYLAFGTPGGDQQDQWTLVFWLNHVHFGMNLQAAIDAPTFHSEHFPSSFYPRESHPGRVAVEGRLDPETIAELEHRGHDVAVAPDWSLGRISAVAQDKRGGVLRAAANPRGMQGYAVGR